MDNPTYDFAVSLPLTLLEASLIKTLRKVRFGEIRVFKQKGEPLRVEIIESKKLSKTEGANMDDAVIMPNIDPNKLIDNTDDGEYSNDEDER